MTEEDSWFTLEKLSLSLKDAAVLLRANHHGVGYEAAAVLAYKEKSQMKKKQLTVKEIVESVTSDDSTTFTGRVDAPLGLAVCGELGLRLDAPRGDEKVVQANCRYT